MNHRIAMTAAALAASIQLVGCGAAVTYADPNPVVVTARRPAPAPVVEAPPPRIEVTDRILFHPDSARIRPESLPVIEDVAQQIAAQPDSVQVLVEGHTAGQRRPTFNRELSQRRADQVVEHLIELGIPAERLQAEGFGFDRPVADNDTREGRAQNRRVEFTVIHSEG